MISTKGNKKPLISPLENSELIDLLVSLIEYRELDDLSRAKRIREYTSLLLNQIYKEHKEKYNLSKEMIEMYTLASTFHDIGKIFIPDHILLKKGILTPEERELLILHSNRGAEVISKFSPFFSADFINACLQICKHHHERWDGTGYPDKLKGEEIPFGARVVAIVDVYDALTCVKPYKPRLPHKTAVEMITQGDCGMFDPEILNCFKQVKNKFEKVKVSYFGKFKGI